MPHLVRYGEHAVQRILLIKQHERVRVPAGGVCAAALALVFIHVYPAAVKALLKHAYVVRPKRLQRTRHYLLGLLIGYLLVGVAHYGCV